MFEFHVDSHNLLVDKVKYQHFGGNLSVRKPPGSKIFSHLDIMK